VAVFKSLLSNDIKNTKSVLNQLVDIVREDISGSNSRKSYEVFVTSSYGPGVTSSLYQTVFDQDFSLQTANSLFDLTFGFHSESTPANRSDIAPRAFIAGDTAAKKRYKYTSLMMREKQDLYKQFAANLLGSSTSKFVAPFGSADSNDEINSALFFTFHRLFVRDGIKRETFAMRMNYNLANLTNVVSNVVTIRDNLFQTQGTNERIYTDFGSSTNRPVSFGGEVGNIVYASDTTKTVGLIFYDHGTVVLNAEAVFAPTDVGYGMISHMSAVASSGSVSSVFPTAGQIPAGKALFGPPGQIGTGANIVPTFLDSQGGQIGGAGSDADTEGGKVFPYFFTSGSLDDIVGHVCSTRFGSDAGTAITFQNKTEINSTIYFIRAQPDEFNYSSNPTYVNEQGRIIVTDDLVNALQKPFSYITTVGLYGDYDDLLAVAKLSRPIEKNDEKDLTIRVRLDF
jgi:hypothetical protein